MTAPKLVLTLQNDMGDFIVPKDFIHEDQGNHGLYSAIQMVDVITATPKPYEGILNWNKRRTAEKTFQDLSTSLVRMRRDAPAKNFGVLQNLSPYYDDSVAYNGIDVFVVQDPKRVSAIAHTEVHLVDRPFEDVYFVEPGNVSPERLRLARRRFGELTAKGYELNKAVTQTPGAEHLDITRERRIVYGAPHRFDHYMNIDFSQKTTGATTQ